MPTPQELVIANYQFPADLTAATENFARSRPWRGNIDLRSAKFREFHEALFGGGGPALILDIPDPETSSGASQFNPEMNVIEMKGKLSVVTYLMLYFVYQAWEAAQNDRWDGVNPMAKTMTLFSRVFPNSFAKLHNVGNMFVSGGLHRDSRPVQAPSAAQGVGEEANDQEIAPSAPVLEPCNEQTPDVSDGEL